MIFRAISYISCHSRSIKFDISYLFYRLINLNKILLIIYSHQPDKSGYGDCVKTTTSRWNLK